MSPITRVSVNKSLFDCLLATHVLKSIQNYVLEIGTSCTVEANSGWLSILSLRLDAFRLKDPIISKV